MQKPSIKTGEKEQQHVKKKKKKTVDFKLTFFISLHNSSLRMIFLNVANIFHSSMRGRSVIQHKEIEASEWGVRPF